MARARPDHRRHGSDRRRGKAEGRIPAARRRSGIWRWSARRSLASSLINEFNEKKAVAAFLSSMTDRANSAPPFGIRRHAGGVIHRCGG